MNDAAEIEVEKWRPLLEHATHEVFEIMLACKLDPGTPEPFDGIEFTAVVGVAGSISALLSVRCCHKSAVRLASAMLHLTLDEAGEHAWDALGEVANMIAGNFKNKIDAIAENCSLSVPTIITGSDYSFRSAGQPLELWFRLERKPIHIVLTIQS
jgi:chemotaxis protein CheX